MPGIAGRIFHVNVNCSELDTSLAFYRDRIGLTPAVRTTPERPQAGAAFGLDQAQWDAWIMTSRQGVDAVVIDLLQWKIPPPSRAAGLGGLQRLRLGVEPSSTLAAGDDSVDPDGVSLEVVADDGACVAGVVVTCSDLDRSRDFYRDVLGLTRAATSTFCDSRGPEVFSIELIAGPSIARPRLATDVGIYRLAMITDDLDRDVDTLAAADVQPYSPPTTLDMGPGLPRLRAVFFPDPDGTTLELIEQPDPPGVDD
jgi:catechol 2,3-dioxygenase-like lactoylglutathione lyase family enzyme